MQNPNILYENRFLDATPVALPATETGFNVLNLRDWRPYTWWKPTALPATVTVDCGSAKSADYALIWGHDLFSHGATLEIRGSTDNFTANNALISSRTPTNNLPFHLQFVSVSYRYWRIRIIGTTVPSIAIAAIGVALVVPTQLEYGFDPIKRTIVGQSNRSEMGHPLGRSIAFEEWSASLTFTNILQSWIRSNFMPAWKAHLRGTPFVFAWNADENATEIYLVQAGDSVTQPHHLPTRANLTIDVKGLALP